jgi:hypothetical protein
MERPLVNVLCLIRESGSISSADLARRANMSVGLMTQAVHDLTRGGFLESVRDPAMDGCTPSCNDCLATSDCRLPVWRLTDKARKVLASAR